MPAGENLCGDLAGGCARDRKANAAKIAAHDGRGDADDRSMHVDERAARVARIDRGVGLQKLLEGILQHTSATSAADDAVGDCAVEAKRVADRPDHFAHFQTAAVAPRRGDEVVSVDPQNGQVAGCVRAHELRIKLPSVGQIDPDGVCLGYHVVVGHDHARSVDNHP